MRKDWYANLHFVVRCYDEGDQLLWVGWGMDFTDMIGRYCNQEWWPDVDRIEASMFKSARKARVERNRVFDEESPVYNRNRAPV